MIANEQFQKAADLINASSNVLITAHTRPDGDACGSIRALCDMLTALGKKANPILLSPLSDWYEFLFPVKVPVLGNDVTNEQLASGEFGTFDLVIIVDTNSYVQLPEFDNWLKQNSVPVLVIDHHVTGDGLGDIELVDSTAAAAGEIVYELLKFASWPITTEMAEALFVAFATDTGWFKFSNTDSRMFRYAAELVDRGAQPASIYRRLYQNVSPARIKLMTRMLESLVLYHDDQVAVQVIMRKDFDETGATGRDTENLIDECQRIGSVDVAVLLVELADGGFRGSLRSKGKVDVRQIAQRYGGGGHTMASGVNLPGPVETAKEMILSAAAEQLNA
jgi:phosphoesterase RecJ-like protein